MSPVRTEMPYIKEGVGQPPKWVDRVQSIQVTSVDCITLFRQLKPHFPQIGVTASADGCVIRFRESKEHELRRNLVLVTGRTGFLFHRRRQVERPVPLTTES